MKTIAYCLFISCLMLSLGCKEDKIILNEDIEIQLGESASLENGTLELHFKEVLEDSRCPKDMMCIWGGRVWIKLAASNASGKSDLELITINSIDGDAKSTAEFGPYLIEIKKVKPDFPPQKLDSKKYKVTLNVRVL